MLNVSMVKEQDKSSGKRDWELWGTSRPCLALNVLGQHTPRSQLQEATACLDVASKTSTSGHYWVTELNGALAGPRVGPTDILNTKRAPRVNSVRINSTELIEVSKTGLDWHFLFKPTLCGNSDKWKLLPGSVLRLPRDYWTFYKKKQRWVKKNLCTKVVLQEEWDLDSVSSIWKATPCKFHIPRAHNYWKGQPIPQHPAETGSLWSKAGKIHGPRRYKPLSPKRNYFAHFSHFFPPALSTVLELTLSLNSVTPHNQVMDRNSAS